MLASAPVAGVHVAAEDSDTARFDVGHDLEPAGVDTPFPALTEGATAVQV